MAYYSLKTLHSLCYEFHAGAYSKEYQEKKKEELLHVILSRNKDYILVISDTEPFTRDKIKIRTLYSNYLYDMHINDIEETDYNKDIKIENVSVIENENLGEENERNNFDSIIKLSKYFLLSEDSRDIFTKYVSRFPESMGKNPFELDNFGRRVYSAKYTSFLTEDVAYYEYLKVMIPLYFEKKWYDIMDDMPLLSYKTFSSGKFYYKGREFKLFKFLLNKKLISMEVINRLNAEKSTVENEQLIVISKNPTDILFCATHQPFTSCMSLFSEYKEAYYLGLATAIYEPHRYIAFTLNNNSSYKKECCMLSENFIHYHMKERSFLYPANDEKSVAVDRMYPNHNRTISKLLEVILYSKFKFIDRSLPDSLYPYIENFKTGHFKPLNFSDGSPSFPYTDYMVLESAGGGEYYYSAQAYGSGAYRQISFNITNGFGSVSELRDAQLEDEYLTCSSCGCLINREEYETYYTEYGEIYCERCHDENFAWCEHCGAFYDVNDGMDVHISNSCSEYWCRSCIDTYAERCCKCNSLFDKDAQQLLELRNNKDGFIGLICRDCATHICSVDIDTKVVIKKEDNNYAG